MMTAENDKLMKRLSGLMKKSQTASPVVEEVVEPVTEQGTDNSNPLKEINASVKTIRASLKKAELGDRSAIKGIDSELIAIERALDRASKFSLL